VDLADRLLPAFKSPTQIPYPRVNLRYGVPETEITETCTAGAGSLLLEFGTLSRLTNNPIYESVAQVALEQIFAQRHVYTGLVANTIDVITGEWTSPHSGIGAGIDSFLEYALKSSILFVTPSYWTKFTRLYSAIERYIKDYEGFIYMNVNFGSAVLVSPWMDSLAAFWPGQQVLAGDIPSAIKGHLQYWTIWTRYGMLPERYDFTTQKPDIAYYPVYTHRWGCGG